MGKRDRESIELLEEEPEPKKEKKKKKKEKKEKKEFKIPKKSIIIEIILVFFTLLFIIGSILLLFDILGKKDKYSNEIKEYEEKIKTKNKELDDIKVELSHYKDLDNSIKNKKDEYYNLLKEFESKVLDGESDKKIAYLTFDDGPYYNTYRVFDILDEYGVKATFFTTNTNGEYCFDNKGENCWVRYKEYLDRGHTIANHTYTHAIFRGLYNSVDSFMGAVIDQENLVKEQTGGYVTNILRFPGGSVTAGNLKESIIERLRERGYGWIDWSALDGDAEDVENETQAWNYLMSTLGDKVEVILFHDYSSITSNILPDVINHLREEGYVLLPLFYESRMVNK